MLGGIINVLDLKRSLLRFVCEFSIFFHVGNIVLKDNFHFAKRELILWKFHGSFAFPFFFLTIFVFCI